MYYLFYDQNEQTEVIADSKPNAISGSKGWKWEAYD